ncbi:MAG: TraR/DksA family transcriptional regulator [Victivallales bacterium]|nr:TraR/DksA family transcriptional regulator [Victivallales bacterium]
MPFSCFKDLSSLSEKERKYFDALMIARDIVTNQMNHHASSALNGEGSKHGAVTHMADYGGENFRRDIELQMMTEDGNVLELIEDAIRRLMNGEYGKCVDCDQPIPEGRLEVKPYAIYCTKCKAIREQNNGINPNIDKYK